MAEPGVPLRPEEPWHPGSVRLFCFPHAGGNSSSYRAWPRLKGITLRPVELPGRQGRFREPALDRMDALTGLLIRELGPEFRQPFAFFGHSMGALVAYALALELRRRAMPLPRHLLLSSHPAPPVRRRGVPLHLLPDDKLIAHMEQLNRGFAGTALRRELLAVMLPTLRADVALCETYQPQAEGPLDVPIAAFGGLSDRNTGQAELAAWRQHTLRAFSLWRFPGGHHYLNGAGDALRATIARLLQGGAPVPQASRTGAAAHRAPNLAPHLT